MQLASLFSRSGLFAPAGIVQFLLVAGTLILLLGSVAHVTAAPLNETWSATFGGPFAEGASAVIPSGDGGYVIAGSTRSDVSVVSSDALLINADSTGTTVWQWKFGGSVYDTAKSVSAVCGDGYIVSGTSRSFSPGGGQDAWLIRTGNNGTERWNRSYGGWGTEYFNAVIPTTDGGFAATGTSDTFGSGLGDVYLVKTGPDGTEEWHTTFGGTKYDYGTSLQQLPDGGYILAGTTYSLGQNESNVYLARTDGTGQLIWQKTFGHNRLSFGNDLLVLSDGGFVVVGWTDPYPSPGRRSVYAVRTDRSGNIVWEKTPGDDRIISSGNSVAQTADGGFVITGGSLGLFLVGLAADGTTEWEKVIARSPNDSGNAIEPAPGGGFIIGGSREQPGNNWDAYLVRVDPDAVLPIPVALPGMTRLPTDPDGDGLYEDLNGNCAADFNDVVLFFTYLEWIGENEPISLFDFNGNGQVDFADITRLFEEL
jgi:PKD repeat protein